MRTDRGVGVRMRAKDYFGFDLPDTARFVAFHRGSKTRAAHSYSNGRALPFAEVFRRFPPSRYQYALYLPSTDLVVVDIDVKSNPRAPQQLREWLRQNNVSVENYFLVRTPSGGMHAYFRLPQGVVRGRWINALASEGIPGVDLLAEGVVFLPKAQVDDKWYRLSEPVKCDYESLDTLPEPFLTLIRNQSQWASVPLENGSPTETDEYLARRGLLDVSLVSSFLKSLGSRVHSRGNRIQASCPYHDDEHPSLSLWVREDKLLVHCFACDSEERGRTYRRFVEDYIRWASNSHGGLNGSARRLPTLADLREAVRTRPKRQGVWGPLFQQGTLTMLGGYQRDFKSTLMKNVMAAVSRGRPLNGLPTKHGLSLLIAYEEPLDYLTSRFDALDVDPTQIVIVGREPVLEDSPTVSDLEEDPLGVLEHWIAEYRPTLVVLDTAWNFVTAWKSAYHRATRSAVRLSPMPTNEEIHYLFSQIKSIAERYDTAIVFIWHRRKGDDMGKDALSGVRALSASADSAVLIERLEAFSSTVKLVAEGRHPTLVWELEFDEVTGVLKETKTSNHSSEDPTHNGTDASRVEESETEPKESEVHEAEPQENNLYKPEPYESEADESEAHNCETYGHESANSERNDFCSEVWVSDETNSDLTTLEEVATIETEKTVSVVSNGGLYHGQFSQEYETMPKLEPMGWYKFQTQANHASVLRLNLPAERKGDRSPYYVALAPSRNWRERGVYGCTVEWAIQGKSCYTGYMPEQVPRVVFDIECESVDPKRSRVIGIAIRAFVPSKTGVPRPIAKVHVLDPDHRTDDDERALIQWFDEQLQSLDPWWLGGYNIFGFDIPFLMERARRLGISLQWLTKHFYRRHIKFRYGSSEKDVDAWFARHDPKRAIIDAYLLALRMDVASGGQLQNHKLYTVYEYLFGESIQIDNKSSMAQWSTEAIEELLETDVTCADLVLMRLVSVEFALSEYVPLPFSELLYSGQGTRAETVLIADYIRHRRAIRCEPIQVPESGFRGAISEALRTGVFEPIAKIDVVSLYPSIIIDEALAPRNDYAGRLPVLLREMREVRVQLKKQSDQISQLRQQALKILINSAYGFMGAEGFIFSDPEKSARVAERGRETILLMKSVLETTGNVPLELDTDGILFVPSGDVQRALEELQRRTPFEYEIEHYTKGMILGAKSYVLVDRTGRYIVKGAPLRSRREPRVARDLLIRVVRAVLNREPLEPIVESYFEAVDQTQNPEDLVRIQTYTGKTRMTDGTQPRKGDTVYVWWSKNDSRLQATSYLPDIDAIDKEAVKQYAAQLLARFEPIPEVRQFITRYGGRRQFVQMFSAGQGAIAFDDE